jgi:hypothetical protein
MMWYLKSSEDDRFNPLYLCHRITPSAIYFVLSLDDCEDQERLRTGGASAR